MLIHILDLVPTQQTSRWICRLGRRRWVCSGVVERRGVGGEEHLANDPVLLTVALPQSHHLPP